MAAASGWKPEINCDLEIVLGIYAIQFEAIIDVKRPQLVISCPTIERQCALFMPGKRLYCAMQQACAKSLALVLWLDHELAQEINWRGQLIKLPCGKLFE